MNSLYIPAEWPLLSIGGSSQFIYFQVNVVKLNSQRSFNLLLSASLPANITIESLTKTAECPDLDLG